MVVVLAARHVITRRSLEETKKLITFTLETAIAAADPVKNPLSQILCLFDLSGAEFIAGQCQTGYFSCVDGSDVDHAVFLFSKSS